MEIFAQHRPDLVITDWMMPDLTGVELCRRVRAEFKESYAYIILLTSMTDKRELSAGLAAGADDYLTKPFAFRELAARVRALLRRESASRTVELHFADITLDTGTHEARRGERVIPLNSKEYALLEYLMRHPHQVLTRTMIAEHVWDCDAEHLSNVIDVYIRYLRRKLCEFDEPDVIHTIRGSGYQLKEPVA